MLLVLELCDRYRFCAVENSLLGLEISLPKIPTHCLLPPLTFLSRLFRMGQQQEPSRSSYVTFMDRVSLQPKLGVV